MTVTAFLDVYAALMLAFGAGYPAIAILVMLTPGVRKAYSQAPDDDRREFDAYDDSRRRDDDYDDWSPPSPR